MPTDQQGIKDIGHSTWARRFVASHLQEVAQDQQRLLRKIPMVKDLQCAWLILLHCAAARANYQFRSVRSSATRTIRKNPDEGVLQGLATILGTDLGQCAKAVRELVTLPLWLGGMGLNQCDTHKGAAHWAVGLTVCP